MKKALLYLMTFMAFVACDSVDDNTDKPQPKPQKDVIEIVIDESKLTAFQVVYSLIPEDKEAYYYCDVMSKTRWATASVESIKKDFEESLENFAQMTGATMEEVKEQMLFKGDELNFVSNAGYRGNTDFVIFAFYWDDEDNVSVKEFTTPAPVASTEDVAISFEGVDSYSMTVKCEPTADVDVYYYHFAETAKVDAMLAQLGDDNAYLSYHAMNVSVKYSGEQAIQQMGLKPETSYTAIIMAIDNKGHRMMTRKERTTPAVQQNERVESALFDSLVGEWSGVQTICDGYSEPAVSEFNVTIAASVEDYDYDYRANNQLVALVDGWNSIDYYGIADLIEYEIENPEEKFGPKWVLDIAEGDVVTIDAHARYSVVGWMFMGNCFMVSAEMENMIVNTDTTLNVEVSADGNTLTISSPVSGLYPSLAYDFTGFGWKANFYGMSDIVLTRK